MLACHFIASTHATALPFTRSEWVHVERYALEVRFSLPDIVFAVCAFYATPLADRKWRYGGCGTIHALNTSHWLWIYVQARPKRSAAVNSTLSQSLTVKRNPPMPPAIPSSP